MAQWTWSLVASRRDFVRLSHPCRGDGMSRATFLLVGQEGTLGLFMYADERHTGRPGCRLGGGGEEGAWAPTQVASQEARAADR